MATHAVVIGELTLGSGLSRNHRALLGRMHRLPDVGTGEVLEVIESWNLNGSGPGSTWPRAAVDPVVGAAVAKKLWDVSASLCGVG
jgi:hypothetical protein